MIKTIVRGNSDEHKKSFILTCFFWISLRKRRKMRKKGQSKTAVSLIRIVKEQAITKRILFESESSLTESRNNHRDNVENKQYTLSTSALLAIAILRGEKARRIMNNAANSPEKYLRT